MKRLPNPPTEAAPRRPAGRRNAATAAIGAAVVFGMVGASFAAVPLYRLFCEVTGFGGTTQRADGPADRVLDREVTVRFDANTSKDLPWSFAPMQRRVKLRIGETATISYVAENRSDRPTTGTAVFNVVPELVGGYFNKVACFCFTEQTLQPGERIEMPVVFYVDPAMADDKNLDHVDTVTLSYTFFPAESAAPAKPVAAVSERPADRL